MNLNIVEFVRSCADMSQTPRDRLPEIAFAGKSNVGKSSVINCLLRRKNFARVGQAPGKTIHINYFRVDNRAYFVDLPGYGYAKVSQSERERWGRLMEEYFASGHIRLGILVVDARHKPTENDVTMANWFMNVGCPFVVVANKTDTLKKSQYAPNMELIRTTLQLPEDCVLIPFSAEKGEGREQLLSQILSVDEKKE